MHVIIAMTTSRVAYYNAFNFFLDADYDLYNIRLHTTYESFSGKNRHVLSFMTLSGNPNTKAVILYYFHVIILKANHRSLVQRTSF